MSENGFSVCNDEHLNVGSSNFHVKQSISRMHSGPLEKGNHYVMVDRIKKKNAQLWKNLLHIYWKEN